MRELSMLVSWPVMLTILGCVAIRSAIAFPTEQTTSSQRVPQTKKIGFYEKNRNAAFRESVVDDATEEGRGQVWITPEMVCMDERGNISRVHEYFGQYNWHGDETFQSMPDSVMAYWLLQLMNFTYDYGKIRREDATWQSVEYTWQIERGVCRDSATLLADMLGAREYDARLVLGDMVDSPGALPDDTTGHAWVVVRDTRSGAEYLLESTQETWDWSSRFPPRTFTMPQYLPIMQVNYDSYFTRHRNRWTSEYTTDWSVMPTGNPRCWINHNTLFYGYSIR